MKKCTTCKIKKSLKCFSDNKATKDGKHSQCKKCNKISTAKYGEKYKNEIKQKRKEKYWEDVEKSREESRVQYQKHKIRKQAQNKKWKEDNPDYMKEYHKNWYNKNRKDKLKKNREWEKKEMAINPLFRLKKNLRIRIIDAIKGKNKSKKTFELIGCNIDRLKEHLEKQFDKNMTWENYGSYWHVDHKIPCAAFDLSKETEQKICFHYRNLQPMEAIKNISKKEKIFDHQLSLTL